MTNTSLVTLAEAQLKLVDLAAADAARLSSRFNEISQRLRKVSAEIVEHCKEGDLQDQQRNSQLWHDLNNVHHLVQQFSNYAGVAVEEFSRESLKLIEALREQRPPQE